MFYIPAILARKGPLSVVWLAAHFDKKLTKDQILKANIDEIIDTVINSNLKISLRITSDLIIGVCNLNKRKIKYLVDESQECINMVQSLTNKIDQKRRKKKRAKSIDLPDQEEFINLNIPEIFEFTDLSIPSSHEIFQRIVSKRNITLDEIPPLTEEELREEEEIQKRIYALGETSILDEGDDFFEDFLPPPPQSEMIATSPDQNLVPDTDFQSPPRAESPIIDLPENAESIEQRRKVDTGSPKLGSLKLPRLDESSIRSIQEKRRTRLADSRPRRRRRLVNFDPVIKIPDESFRQAMSDEGIPNKIVPNIFIAPIGLVESHISLLSKPERCLPKILEQYFTSASNHFEDEESLVFSHHEADDFFDDSNLPPVELGSPSGQDQFAPEMFDDFEEQLPMVRARTAAEMGDADQRFDDFPEFSITERTIIEERFNNSLQDMLSQTDFIQFDQLSLVDNKKRTAALYFCNLLEMKNNQIIDLDQEPSLEQFNPINIIHIEKSETI